MAAPVTTTASLRSVCDEIRACQSGGLASSLVCYSPLAAQNRSALRIDKAAFQIRRQQYLPHRYASRGESKR